MLGGYFEYKTRADGPPLTLMVGGAVAIVSAISIFFLDGQPRTLFERPPRTWQPASHRGSSELLAGLRRTGCFGRCAAYTVAIYRDGVIEYNGEFDVGTQGRAIGQLLPDELRKIEEHFTQADFFSFGDSYLDRGCTDLPTVYTWYRPLDRATKSVAHYLGDRSAPKALLVVEESLDAAIKIEQWIGPEKNHPGPNVTYCR